MSANESSKYRGYHSLLSLPQEDLRVKFGANHAHRQNLWNLFLSPFPDVQTGVSNMTWRLDRSEVQIQANLKALLALMPTLKPIYLSRLRSQFSHPRCLGTRGGAG